MGTAHHFAIGSGAFRVSRVFSNFEGISGWAVKPPNAWLLAPAVSSKPIFFPKCWPIKELTRVWKLSLCARAPDSNYDISCFPIGPKANGDRGCSSLCNRFRGFSRRSRFLKLWGHQRVGCENLRMHGSQLLLWAASQFFSKMLTYKRAYLGVKIIIVRARPGPQLWYFLFSHRAQGK